MGIFQKYFIGYFKGVVGVWMLNGCLQVFNSGFVFGNCNVDNVDVIMEKFDYIVYFSCIFQIDGVKVFLVIFFGFGQKGVQVIGIYFKYLYVIFDQ